MAKYTVDFEFTPTLENAPDLLMDIAALVSTCQPAAQPTKADHSGCIAVGDHQAAMADLQHRIEELQERNKSLYLSNEQLKLVLRTPQPPAPTPAPQQARQGTIPRIGEIVKLLPHPGHEGWTTGVVKAWHGHGGSKGIEVLPKGHGRTEIIERKYLRRYAENERADEAAAPTVAA